MNHNKKSEKFITKISDEAERKRGEEVLDEAIENTFPASMRTIRKSTHHCYHQDHRVNGSSVSFSVCLFVSTIWRVGFACAQAWIERE